MKNVLVVIPTYFPETRAGGPVTGCRQLVKALASFCNVSVVTLNTVPVSYSFAHVDNVFVRYLPYSSIFDFLSNSSWGFSLDFSVWFIRNVPKFDHIYFRSFWNYISFLEFFVVLSMARAIQYRVVVSLRSMPWHILRTKNYFYFH